MPWSWGLIKSISRSSEPGASWLNSDVMLAAAGEIDHNGIQAKRCQKLNCRFRTVELDRPFGAMKILRLTVCERDFNAEAHINGVSGHTNKTNTTNNIQTNKVLKVVFCHCVLVNRWLASGI